MQSGCLFVPNSVWTLQHLDPCALHLLLYLCNFRYSRSIPLFHLVRAARAIIRLFLVQRVSSICVGRTVESGSLPVRYQDVQSSPLFSQPWGLATVCSPCHLAEGVC